jgi:hypothetical protein
VLRHAPQAAKRSSELGAHRETAAQFARALRYANPSDLEVAPRCMKASRTSSPSLTGGKRPSRSCARPSR